MLIYIVGPYDAPTPEGIQANVDRAVAAGIQLMLKGHTVICPHSMTHGWDLDTGLNRSDFMHNCLTIVSRVDAICLLEGWHDSRGSLDEHEEAIRRGNIIYHGTDEVPDVL